MIHQKNSIITNDLNGGSSAAIKLQASRYNAKKQSAELEALKEELEKIRVAIGLTEIDYTPNCDDIVYGTTQNLTISVLEADKIGIESISIQDTSIAEIVSNSEAIDGTQKIFSYRIKPLKIGKTKFLALLTSKLKINTLVEIDINVISDTVELTINGAAPETIYLKQGETQTLEIYHKTTTPTTLFIASTNDTNLSVSNRIDTDENNIKIDITGNEISEEFLDFETTGAYIDDIITKVNVVVEANIDSSYNEKYESAMRELRNYVILYPSDATGTQTLYVNHQTHSTWAKVQADIDTKKYNCIIVDCTFNSTNVGFGVTGEYITLTGNFTKVIQGENSCSIRIESTCNIIDYRSTTNAARSLYDEDIMSESYSPSYYGDINYLKGNITNMTGGKILQMESGSIATANYVFIRWKNSGFITIANYCSIFYHNETSTNANYISYFNNSLMWYHGGDYIDRVSASAIMYMANTALVDKMLSGFIYEVQDSATISTLLDGYIVINSGKIETFAGGCVRTNNGSISASGAGGTIGSGKNPYTTTILYLADPLSDDILEVSGATHTSWDSIQTAINSKLYSCVKIDETFTQDIIITAGHFSEIQLSYYYHIAHIGEDVIIDKLTHIGGNSSSRISNYVYNGEYNIDICYGRIKNMHGGSIGHLGHTTTTSIDNMYGGMIGNVWGHTAKNGGSYIVNMYGGVIINLLNGSARFGNGRIKNMYGGYVIYLEGAGNRQAAFIEYMYGGALNNVWSGAHINHLAGGRINYIRDGFQSDGPGYINLMTGGNIGYIETSLTGSSMGSYIMKMEGGIICRVPGGGGVTSNDDGGGINGSAMIYHLGGGCVCQLEGTNSGVGGRVMNMSGGYVHQGTNYTNRGTIVNMTGGGVGGSYLTVTTASSPAKVGSCPDIVKPSNAEIQSILNIAKTL